MTPSPTERAISRDDLLVARLAAAAVAIALAEAALPSPIPGVKPGLANIVVLLVLARYGWRVAAWVSVLRVVAASLLLGNFLSPGFVLSLAGALASLLVLVPAARLPKVWFGPVSHSLLAACAHVLAQLAVVYFWLIPSPALWHLLPLFLGAALVFGLVNGLIAQRLLDAPAASG
ncbi:MAG: Gx transporter family protein [Burkholderiales bacterium]|nr:MAG: Gx transporter family protein [Burkholderiales bacterium]